MFIATGHFGRFGKLFHTHSCARYSLVIKYFQRGSYAPLACCAREQLPLSASPPLYDDDTSVSCFDSFLLRFAFIVTLLVRSTICANGAIAPTVKNPRGRRHYFPGGQILFA